MMDFIDFAQQCAPTVAPETMAAIVNVESSFQPYAIGVVDGALKKQPQHSEEALLIIKQLEKAGHNFSIGLAQVNRYNLPRYGISYAEAFDPCINLQVGSKILEDCYKRAVVKFPEEQTALQAAFSCYYSGNFSRGFKREGKEHSSYVEKVLASNNQLSKNIPIVPPIKTKSNATDAHVVDQKEKVIFKDEQNQS